MIPRHNISQPLRRIADIGRTERAISRYPNLTLPRISHYANAPFPQSICGSSRKHDVQYRTFVTTEGERGCCSNFRVHCPKVAFLCSTSLSTLGRTQRTYQTALPKLSGWVELQRPCIPLLEHEGNGESRCSTSVSW